MIRNYYNVLNDKSRFILRCYWNENKSFYHNLIICRILEHMARKTVLKMLLLIKISHNSAGNKLKSNKAWFLLLHLHFSFLLQLYSQSEMEKWKSSHYQDLTCFMFKLV